jgi:hypothetical protein
MLRDATAISKRYKMNAKTLADRRSCYLTRIVFSAISDFKDVQVHLQDQKLSALYFARTKGT